MRLSIRNSLGSWRNKQLVRVHFGFPDKKKTLRENWTHGTDEKQTFHSISICALSLSLSFIFYYRVRFILGMVEGVDRNFLLAVGATLDARPDNRTICLASVLKGTKIFENPINTGNRTSISAEGNCLLLWRKKKEKNKTFLRE